MRCKEARWSRGRRRRRRSQSTFGHRPRLGKATAWSSLPENFTYSLSKGSESLGSKVCSRTSLVAQWLRICMSMQGTWAPSLLQEDPTCRGATKPMHHNYRAHALELVLCSNRSHRNEKPDIAFSVIILSHPLWILGFSCLSFSNWLGLCLLSDPLHCVGSLLISDYLIVGLFTLLDFQEFEGSNALFSVSSSSNLMKDVLNRCFLTKSSGADPTPRTWRSSAVFWHTTRCLWIISTNSFLWLLTLSFNNVM